MGQYSDIEWTDATWNPVTGCTKVSLGCKNCYAERVFSRAYSRKFVRGDGKAITDSDPPTTSIRPRRFTDVLCHEERLEQPLRWRRPRKVFVNSMSDLFHEDVRDTFIADVFGVMARSPWHTFQILTKRPKRMVEWMETGSGWMTAALNFQDRELGGFAYPWPLPNVWLGVSVEDQKTADERIPLLLQTPAEVRCVSYEPALAPVDFRRIAANEICRQESNVLNGWIQNGVTTKLDWVIIGGESGPGARPFNIQWARDVIAQCQAAGVACFVKQLGRVPMLSESEWRQSPAHRVPLLNAHNHQRVPADMVPLKFGDSKGGDISEWPLDLRIREFPEVRV